MSEFPLEDIKNILRDCSEYESGHHLRRPFMSAYQIAIEFAQRHPEHPAVKGLAIGGAGTGENQSLAQRIARFLSSKAKDPDRSEIEGAFLSHVGLAEMTFRGDSGEDIRVSTLSSKHGHSIFRIKE